MLDREHLWLVPVAELRGVDQVVRLVGLATEAENDIGADVRVIDHARHRPLELTEVGRSEVRAAPPLGWQGQDAGHVRVLVHDRVVAEMVGNPPDGG